MREDAKARAVGNSNNGRSVSVGVGPGRVAVSRGVGVDSGGRVVVAQIRSAVGVEGGREVEAGSSGAKKGASAGVIVTSPGIDGWAAGTAPQAESRKARTRKMIFFMKETTSLTRSIQ